MNITIRTLVLAGLGFALIAPEADACGRKRKAKAAPVSSCNTCTSTYGTVGTQPVYASGQPVYAPGQRVILSTPTAPQTMPVNPATTTGTVTSKPATITVTLPSEDAQLWVDGVANTQNGKERTLTTAPLEDGKVYTYSIKAKWTDSGKAVEKTQSATVRAGKTTAVEFR